VPAPPAVLPKTGFPTGWVLLAASVLCMFGVGLLAARPGPSRRRGCHR
jgi:LPXTG-motif cell wall-anchored protein